MLVSVDNIFINTQLMPSIKKILLLLFLFLGVLLIISPSSIEARKSLRVLKGKGVCNFVTCLRECQQTEPGTCGICRDKKCTCIPCN